MEEFKEKLDKIIKDSKKYRKQISKYQKYLHKVVHNPELSVTTSEDCEYILKIEELEDILEDINDLTNND